MATKKKMLEAAAGGAGGASLDITDVFSTYLYDGDSTNPSAKVNGIDLAGEGGMVWLKSRTGATNNYIADTEQPLSSGGGATWLYTNTTDAALGSTGTGLLGFNSNGFSTFATGSGVNSTGNTYASWTFRKAPKFFDCVTWTGTGVARAIAHNLGSVPGMIIVKATSKATNWEVYHRSLTAADHIFLNLTNAKATATQWNTTEPTDSVFTVGTHGNVNTLGSTYVAYLFAHNDSGDGEFGPDSDQDIIKCGSFNSGGSAADVDVNLGFEPQFVMFKLSSSAGGWYMYDTMRGIVTGGNDALLFANTSSAETVTGDYIDVTSTGFKFTAAGWNGVSGPNHDLIYMAIRRGPLAPPEAGTEVFKVDSWSSTTEPAYTSNFPVDMALHRLNASGANAPNVNTRMLGATKLLTSSTAAESAESNNVFDFMDGWYNPQGYGPFSNYYSWMWKRAPSYFDVVAYTGTGGTTSQKAHNLGVVPEMIWVKTRSLTGREWVVWVDGFGTGQTNGTGTKEWLYLNTTASLQSTTSSSNTPWGGPHTETTFSTGSWSRVNDTGETYIAYLFASLAGVSKVSSYTGNGSSQTINAGFTAGARFILIKRTDSTGDWYVWDTARGVVAGNSPHLSLNTTSAEVTSDDSIDPDSSGFIVNQVAATNINVSSATYIYYAVA